MVHFYSHLGSLGMRVLSCDLAHIQDIFVTRASEMFYFSAEKIFFLIIVTSS